MAVDLLIFFEDANSNSTGIVKGFVERVGNKSELTICLALVVELHWQNHKKEEENKGRRKHIYQMRFTFSGCLD